MVLGLFLGEWGGVWLREVDRVVSVSLLYIRLRFYVLGFLFSVAGPRNSETDDASLWKSRALSQKKLSKPTSLMNIFFQKKVTLFAETLKRIFSLILTVIHFAIP